MKIDRVLSEFSVVDVDRYDIIFLSILSIAFAGLSLRFFWFTLDDAYITLRYSKHLAEGYGIVWNAGTDPVEGYTSFLWMIIGVIPHLIDLPPITFMKFLGVISTFFTIIVLYTYGRFRSVNRWILVIGSAQIAVSPAIAVLSIQGMETTFSMFLILLSTIAAIEVIQNYEFKWAVIMNVTLFLSMLTRPDLVVFAIFLEFGIMGSLYRQNRTQETKHLFITMIMLVFIPGLIYMITRFTYFGYIFPNPFYIKSGLSILGPIQVFEFVMLLAGPILFLTLAMSLLHPRSRSALVKMAPLYLAIVTFLGLYIYIKPIQGFLYRFLVPVFPAAILVLIISMSRSKLKLQDIGGGSSPIVRGIIAFLLISGLFVYPMFTYREADLQTDQRTQGDRVVMGQALGSFENKDYKMFVTESGAIPYYSEWESIDELGLNSEYITHNGLNKQYLSEYEPDLVQMLVRGQPNMIRAKSPETATYLNSSSYALVAVVYKQNADQTNIARDKFHVYFVNKESEGYSNIACTVLSQDLEYADPSIVTQQAAIDIQVSNMTKEGCNGTV